MRSSVEWTLARLTLRQVTANRRVLGALLLAALPVLLGWLAARRAGPEGALGFLPDLYQSLTVPVLLPLVALVVGTGVFGHEVDDGTITYVLGKPVARWRIVLVRILTAGAVTALVVAPSTLAAGLAALRGGWGNGLVLGFTLAVAVGAFLYCALFVALSLSTRRALVAGLVYVVLWEGALSGSLAGLRALSVRQYTLSFASALGEVPAEVFTPRLGITTALWMSAAVAVLATLHAVRRLRAFEIGEAA